MNLEPKFKSTEFSNIPLLGLSFNKEAENLNDYIEIYSYDIFNHKKVNKITLNLNNLDNIFSIDKNNDINNCNNLNCENCKKNPIEYLCYDCKKNICKNCFKYHKEHKHYNNYDYIPEAEIEKINDKFTKSKNIINSNLTLIEKQISEYETQLNDLKNLYNEYKEINDKLTKFTTSILNIYTDLLKSQKPIYYPIYFNIKNTLIFETEQLIIPEDEDFSIDSFNDFLSKKIYSGFYFIINNSIFSDNLDEYYKENKFKINIDIENINDFTKKKILYNKIIPLNDRKFIGINYKYPNYNFNRNKDKEERNDEKGTEIYDIKNNKVETTIKSCPENIFYNEEFNIIVFIYEYSLEIFNSQDYTLIQKITIDEKRKKRRDKGSSLWNRSTGLEEIYHEFIHVEFISENIFGVLYEGNLSYLGEDIENISDIDGKNIINVENEQYDQNFDKYIYLIIYQRENKNSIFIPKKVSILVKMDIAIKDVPFSSGNYDAENDNDSTYCEFQFDSIIKLSNEEFIIAFRSSIEAERDQGYFYITDNFYKNETIYYRINWEKYSYINESIGATKEKTYLFKNELDDSFYFLYNHSKKFASRMKKYFNEYDLELIPINVDNDKLDIRNLYIERSKIFGWSKNSLYVGKIVCGELQITYNFDFYSKECVKLISLENKSIYYNDEEN